MKQGPVKTVDTNLSKKKKEEEEEEEEEEKTSKDAEYHAKPTPMPS